MTRPRVFTVAQTFANPLIAELARERGAWPVTADGRVVARWARTDNEGRPSDKEEDIRLHGMLLNAPADPDFGRFFDAGDGDADLADVDAVWGPMVAMAVIGLETYRYPDPDRSGWYRWTGYTTPKHPDEGHTLQLSLADGGPEEDRAPAAGFTMAHLSEGMLSALEIVQQKRHQAVVAMIRFGRRNGYPEHMVGWLPPKLRARIQHEILSAALPEIGAKLNGNGKERLWQPWQPQEGVFRRGVRPGVRGRT